MDLRPKHLVMHLRWNAWPQQGISTTWPAIGLDVLSSRQMLQSQHLAGAASAHLESNELDLFIDLKHNCCVGDAAILVGLAR